MTKKLFNPLLKQNLMLFNLFNKPITPFFIFLIPVLDILMVIMADLAERCHQSVNCLQEDSGSINSLVLLTWYG